MSFYIWKNRLLLMLIGLFFFSQPCTSITMTVSSPSDSVAGSLRTVLSLSSAGDSIKFNISGTDTIILKNEIVITGAKVISGINGTTGNKIVIQVPSPGVSPYRVFRISTGSTSPMVVRDVVLRGGRITKGNGGVIQTTGNLSLDNVVVSNGVADTGSGGGIYSVSGSLIINNSTIINNTAKFCRTSGFGSINADGGGIYVYDGHMVITNSTIAGNTTLATNTTATASNPIEAKGGGIYFYKGAVHIENCTVIHNSADAITTPQNTYIAASGGGIYTYEGHLAIVHCTIIKNTCSVGTTSGTRFPMFAGRGFGGGVYSYEPTIGVINSIIVGNTVKIGDSSRVDDISETIWQTKGRALNSIVDSTVNITLTNCLVRQPMQQIFGTVNPILADNGGLTQTILVPANCIASGTGIKSGVFHRDTTISGKSDSMPIIAYFNGSSWIALDNDLPVPVGKTIKIIPLDQRGENRAVPPYIGSVENTAALGVPVPVSPLNGIDGADVNPTLKWLLSSNVLSYRVQVSTSPDFTVMVSDNAGITDTTIVLNGLTKGVKYYWRVNATYSGGTGNWCMPACFSTIADPPGIPVISSPLSASTNLPVATTLFWHPAIRAKSYRIQVSQSADFNVLFKDTSGITDTSFLLTGLAHDTRYYWCVCATNSGGTSGWMQTAYFQTAIAVPAIPLAVSPVSGTLTISTAPTLKWYVSSGAVTYRVQVSLVSSFSTVLIDSALIVDTSLTLNGLVNNVKYYWRINATNGGGSSAWSTVENFATVPLLPGVPAICSPVSGASNQPLTTRLIWHPVPTAISYRVQVSQNADFSTLFKDTSGIVDTTLLLAGLANGTHYYWSVRAVNAGGAGDWMPTAFFSVTAELPMSTVLLLPGDGALMQTDSVRLVWKTGAPAAIQYYVEVATDSAMNHTFFIDSTFTDTMVNIKALSSNIVCWWHVRTRNAAGWGPFSLKRSFRIAATAVLPKQTIPGEFRLSGSSGLFTYCLAEECFVNLSIFDLQGKIVGSYVNKMQVPGWYHIETPGLNLSRGLYVQMFSAGKIKHLRTMAVYK